LTFLWIFKFIIIIIFFMHLFTCAYIVWAISPPSRSPLYPPCFQAEPVLPFSQILLKRRCKQ
jgi:hypothetical protein